jgi:hypothetical protein
VTPASDRPLSYLQMTGSFAKFAAISARPDEKSSSNFNGLRADVVRGAKVVAVRAIVLWRG